MSKSKLIMNMLLAQSPQGQPINIQGQIADITPIASLDQLLQIGASAILTIGTLAVLYYLLYGAFSWITAGGEKGKIEEARTMMTQGIVGLVILASVFMIFGMVLNFLGLRDRFNIGNYGGTATGGQTGGNNAICTVGASGSDGGAGGYCTGGGAAQMKCTTTANITYAHWEPCSCLSGNKAWNWTVCK